MRLLVHLLSLLVRGTALMLGLVGAPLLLASTLVTYFNGNHQIAAVAAVGVAPIFLWELSLGLRLAIRGLGEPTNEPALQLP